MLSVFTSKVLSWITGVLGVFLVLGSLYVYYLHSKVNVLTKENNALVAQAESLQASITALQTQAKKSTTLDIKQSTAKSAITSKLRKSVQAARKEAEHEVGTSITSTELDRLRQLVTQANAGIAAASTDTK